MTTLEALQAANAAADAVLTVKTDAAITASRAARAKTVKAVPTEAAVPPVPTEAPAKTPAAFPFASARTASAADSAIVGTRTIRDTNNPVWSDVEWALSVKAGYVTYTRNEGAKGSPLAKLDAAMARALKLGLKNVGKLKAVPHATDKGVWLLVKYP